MEQVRHLSVSHFPNKGLMLFNVFLLVNTCHALGFSVFLMVDKLTFFKFHLRATEIRLNDAFFKLLEHEMLSKCFDSNRSVFKGWFLKLNKDLVLAMTICHLP